MSTTPSPAAPAQRRRLQKRAEARRTILDATEALLVEAGFERFSMRRLVDRCGYSAPSIYHYFGDKSGLIDALLEERFALLLEELREVRPHPADPGETLRALFLAFVRFAQRHPTHYSLLMTPRDEGSAMPPSAEEAQAMFAVPLDCLARAGRLYDSDVERVRQSYWALLHGLVSLRNSRMDFDWAPELVESALEMLVRGSLLPPSSSASPKDGAAESACEESS